MQNPSGPPPPPAPASPPIPSSSPLRSPILALLPRPSTAGRGDRLLLRDVVDYERETAIRRLLVEPGAGAGGCRRAIRLTGLSISLWLLPPLDRPAGLLAAVAWIEALLAARTRRQDALSMPLVDIAP